MGFVSTLVGLTILIGFVVAIIGGAATMFVRGRRRGGRVAKRAWARMNSWDEVSLGIGLMGQMFLPLVKDESQRQPYLVAVGVNIIEVTTIGLFVAGILSFLKHAHDVEKEYESEAGKN